MEDSSESGPQAGTSEGQSDVSSSGGESLEDAARDEHEVAGQQLRQELGRDPTDAEIDEWLRHHTEGY